VASGGVDVLFQAHGYNRAWREAKAGGTTRDQSEEQIPQQLSPTMIAVLPQGTERSFFGSLNASGIIAEALGLISSSWAKVTPRRIVFGGHSGGGGAVVSMLDLKLKPKQKVPADRAGRQAQRRGHLPSQLSEVVLFDGINGTTQLDIVKSWVLDNIDENREDLEALAGTPPAGRVSRFERALSRFLYTHQFLLRTEPRQTGQRDRQGARCETCIEDPSGNLGPTQGQLQGNSFRLGHRARRRGSRSAYKKRQASSDSSGNQVLDHHLQQALGALKPGAAAPSRPAAAPGSGPAPGGLGSLLSPGSAPANLLLGFLVPGTTVVDVSRLPVLRLGATESAVRLLQLELNVTGASPELTADSNFGRKTDKAVRAFQQRQDLVVDGVVGPNTWAKLDKEVQSRATPTLDRSPPTDVSV
jgi:hypothetical protein